MALPPPPTPEQLQAAKGMLMNSIDQTLTAAFATGCTVRLDVGRPSIIQGDLDNGQIVYSPGPQTIIKIILDHGLPKAFVMEAH